MVCRQWFNMHLKPAMKTGYLLLYCIIIISFYIYYRCVEPVYGDILSNGIPELDILGNKTCAINYKGCEYDQYTGWNIGRFLIFMMVGGISPDAYATIGLFSVIMELMTHSRGGSPRVVTDISTNMLGYIIGSNLKMLMK
jgi:hypothetical protein